MDSVCKVSVMVVLWSAPAPALVLVLALETWSREIWTVALTGCRLVFVWAGVSGGQLAHGLDWVWDVGLELA